MRVEPVDLRQSQPPDTGYLARYPLVGVTISVLGLLVFLFLLVQVLSHGPLTQWDETVVGSLHDRASQSPALVHSVWRAGSLFGYWGHIIIIAGLAIFWWRRHAWRELSLLLSGAVGGEVVFSIIAGAINRPRPSVIDPAEGLLAASYPSGHTLSAVLLFGLLLYLYVPRIRRPAWRVLLILFGLALILWIGFSRLYLGSHYPTDVIGGVALALAWGGFVYTTVDLTWRRRGERSAG